MNEVIEAVRYDLICILQEILCATDERTAVLTLTIAKKRIEQALDEMEAQL